MSVRSFSCRKACVFAVVLPSSSSVQCRTKLGGHTTGPPNRGKDPFQVRCAHSGARVEARRAHQIRARAPHKTEVNKEKKSNPMGFPLPPLQPQHFIPYMGRAKSLNHNHRRRRRRTLCRRVRHGLVVSSHARPYNHLPRRNRCQSSLSIAAMTWALRVAKGQQRRATLSRDPRLPKSAPKLRTV